MKYSGLPYVSVPQTTSAQHARYRAGGGHSFFKAVGAAVLLSRSASLLPGSLSNPADFSKVDVQCCSSNLTTSHALLAFTLKNYK